jgi:hypothetical protein
MEFAQLAGLLYGDHAEFSNFIKSIDTAVRKRLEESRERLLKRKCRLQLYYVSPGKISKPLRDEAYHLVRCKDPEHSPRQGARVASTAPVATGLPEFPVRLHG